MYDSKDAMLTNSIFCDFLLENGLNIYKGNSTRDIICVQFDYGSRAYDDELKHIEKLKKLIQDNESFSNSTKSEKLNRLNFLESEVIKNADKYHKVSKQDIRHEFYKNGVNIKYPKYDRNRKIKDYEIIHYNMLYRTPGKAKKGSCMFIRDSLYEKAKHFLWMGLSLPKENAPIVEIGAYSSLITSTIVDRVKIEPENILILKDVDSFFNTDVISIETDEQKHCHAIPRENYKVKNTLFDGQSLIDESIFPTNANGYVLLRHHFCKTAAFCTKIQKFFKEYFGDKYETATLIDMFGNKHFAKDVKLITTESAVKWIKFNVSYEYWCGWVHKNDCMFGIVKTAHESKLGDVQRMSYQMVNALSSEIMPEVLKESRDYIYKLKSDLPTFLDYLKKNSTFSNDFEVLNALIEQDPAFENCDYFRDRRRKIINTYVNNLKHGRSIQNADNLVVVGSPYAMLLHSVGEDWNNDPTFEHEDGTIQCWTSRFDNGEYLAEFRSPFNSRNNLGYMHNHYHEYFDKYFKFGDLILAVNMIETDAQDRNNGSDQDSDSFYVTNQQEIVSHAKYCYENYKTIVNNIPMEKNHYNSSIESFSTIDNKISASQTDIGESSNLAQICLTYTYNYEDKIFNDYVCVLSVLAQAAVDSSKRTFDVNIQNEIKRIKKESNVKENKYPAFWTIIHPEFNRKMINRKLNCPMNDIYYLRLEKYVPKSDIIPISKFFVNYKYDGVYKIGRKVEDFIEKYSIDLYNFNTQDNTDDIDYLMLKDEFEELIEDIRQLSLGKKYIPLMSWLINRAFRIGDGIKKNYGITESNLNYNRSLLLKTLYSVNKECLLQCFSGNLIQH